jgi:hypothetical protein
VHCGGNGFEQCNFLLRKDGTKVKKEAIVLYAGNH